MYPIRGMSLCSWLIKSAAHRKALRNKMAMAQELIEPTADISKAGFLRIPLTHCIISASFPAFSIIFWLIYSLIGLQIRVRPLSCRVYAFTACLPNFSFPYLSVRCPQSLFKFYHTTGYPSSKRGPPHISLHSRHSVLFHALVMLICQHPAVCP